MKQQIRLFFTALLFYTRIPCPSWVDHSEESLNEATKYFPLIGWIVGGASGMLIYLSTFILPVEIAVIIGMATGILITGAFHEDGFADVCDGFGGGWTREKILSIMKDSLLGTFGVVGLILILAIKFYSLRELAIRTEGVEIIFISILAHSLSRGTSLLMIYTDSYTRDTNDSKVKPIAKQMKTGDFLFGTIVAVIPLMFFELYFFSGVIVALLLLKTYLSYYFKKWIGGYTGDCLGAAQQIAEILIYLFIIIQWSFI